MAQRMKNMKNFKTARGDNILVDAIKPKLTQKTVIKKTHRR